MGQFRAEYPRLYWSSMGKKEKERIRTALADYAASIAFRKDGAITATRYGASRYTGALEREIDALPATISKYHPHEIANGKFRVDITFQLMPVVDCTIVDPAERIALARTLVTLEGRPAVVIGVTEDAPRVVTLWGFPRLYLDCLWQEVRHVIHHKGGQFRLSR